MLAPPPAAVHAAQTIAVVPTVVRCADLSDAEAGRAWPGDKFGGVGLIMLDDSVCRGLYRFIRGSTDGPAVSAVLTLAHEAVHASGVGPETETECRAYRIAPRVVRMLGRRVTRDVRRTLALAHGLNRGWPGYANYRCS